ncbi:hypothetical protein [Marinitoga lauensis]|uniref:hypothetical protein n=1 Tax=Marinitoga lauensis TaxID=2201189 RepID=UPI001F113F6D|nr:hypothetical protein [Marinitoga lauensis]
MSKIEDLELIGEKIKKCDSCSLSLSRTNVVIGEGNADSPIMLVGEGPVQMKICREDRLLEEQVTSLISY